MKTFLSGTTVGNWGQSASAPEVNAAAETTIVFVSPAMVERDPAQPRKEFDETKIQELAESLKRHGQLQPIRIRPSGIQGRYVVVAGERRLRAAKLAGLPKISAIVIAERDNIDAIREEQVVENLQRADLSPMESALAYRSLLERWQCSQSELARRLGVHSSTICRALALLEAPAVEAPRPTKPRKPKAAKADKRRAVELELASGFVRIKRGHTLEQLVEELRGMIDAGRKDAA